MINAMNFLLFFVGFVLLPTFIKTNDNNLKEKNVASFNYIPENKEMFKKSIRINKEANWSLTINYFIGERLDKNTIRSALRTIEKHTCLSFSESSKREENKGQLVYLHSTSACSAITGKNRNNKNNLVNLTRECSWKLNIVLHESCHALGLRHEHQRIDRDRYITIIEENIPKGYNNSIMTLHEQGKHTFFNITYDYASVMHYPGYFANGNRKTIIKVKNIDPYNKMLGNKVGFSFNDLKLLNYYYCMKDCSEGKRDCKNGGYVKQPKCYACICPKGYKGFDCTEAEESLDRRCKNNTNLRATTTTKSLSQHGKAKCNYLIKAFDERKIMLNIKSVETQERKYCFSNLGLEIKYLEDKGVTGLCLCGKYENIEILSENGEVAIEYNGLEDSNSFNLEFHQVSRTEDRNNNSYTKYNGEKFEIIKEISSIKVEGKI